MTRTKASVVSWFRSLSSEKQVMVVLLVLAFLRGLIYAIVVPAWQSADEPQYFIGIQALALRLVPSIARPLIGTELGPLLFFDALYLPPYLATSFVSVALQLLALRLLTVCLSVATIYVIYRVAKLFAPEDRFITLGAPLLVAFIPQFTHEAGSVSPDILATLGGSLFFLFALGLIKDGFGIRGTIGLLVGMAMAVLAKQTAFFVVPAALLLPAAVILRKRPEGLAVKSRNKQLGIWIASLAVVVPLAGWLSSKVTEASFNLDLVREVLAPSFLVSVFDTLKNPADPFFSSFWARIGWLSVPLDNRYYAVLMTLSVAAAAGLAVYFLRATERGGGIERWQVVATIFFVVAVLIEVTIVLARTQLNPATGWAQGRWAFPALAAMATLAVLGWRQPFSERSEMRLLVTFAATMLVLDIVFFWGYVVNTYYATGFPAQLSESGLIWAKELPVETGRETAAMRPSLFAWTPFYVVLFGVYLWVFAYFCKLALAWRGEVSRPALAEER